MEGEDRGDRRRGVRRYAIVAVLGIGWVAASVGGFFFTRDVVPGLPYTTLRAEELRRMMQQNEIVLDGGGRLRWSEHGVILLAANERRGSPPPIFEVHEDRICAYEVPDNRDVWFCRWFSRHRNGDLYSHTTLSWQAWCRLARVSCEGRDPRAIARPPGTKVILRPIEPGA